MRSILYILIPFLLYSCQQSESPVGNRLINEASPYLKQHAYNPVDWYPYGNEAFEKAVNEDKLMIISVGYSACHWCHVMEEETFSDSTIAEVMNKNFVSVKVDREERPDVDKKYIDAASLITENVGWPLNVIALPDGRAFFAGSYFTKSQWTKVLEYFIDQYANSKDKLISVAEQVEKDISQYNTINPVAENISLSINELDSATRSLKEILDNELGGLSGEIKFPNPKLWEYLMHYYYANNDEEALSNVRTTLDAMVNGGIYDHVEGGWARYSTDREWKVPHFEKMLYDNAQLLGLYSSAYKLTAYEPYKSAVEKSFEFLVNEMSNGDGGFYSSFDADSEGEEGTYYIWSKEEVDQVLGADSDLFNDYFQITQRGNWTSGKNVLFRQKSTSALITKYDLSPREFEQIIETGLSKLLEERKKRTRPSLDDKILTSWNAMMVSGLCEAYEAFGERKYLDQAILTMKFIDKNLRNGDVLVRYFKENQADIDGFLDDYSFTVKAKIDLYEATFDEAWLSDAQSIIDHTLQNFLNRKNGMFLYASDTTKLGVKYETTDQVIPSSNGVMAENLLRLGNYYPRSEYLQLAEQMISTMQDRALDNISYHTQWGILMLHKLRSPFEVAIVGEGAEEYRSQMAQQYLPDVFYCGGETEGGLELLKNKMVPNETMVYVCQNKSCRLPVTAVEPALSQIMERRNNPTGLSLQP